MQYFEFNISFGGDTDHDGNPECRMKISMFSFQVINQKINLKPDEVLKVCIQTARNFGIKLFD